MSAQARKPRISIAVPVHNGADYIDEALAALAAQSIEDIEVLICDNASTDSTVDIAQGYAADDPRFHVYSSPTNRGIAWNFNRGLQMARSDLFMWLAYDDRPDPTHLDGCVRALSASPDAVLAFSRVRLIGPAGEHLGDLEDAGLDFSSERPLDRLEEFFAREVLQAVGWGAVARTEPLRDSGGLPYYYGGDVVLGMKLALRGRFLQVRERAFSVRRHSAQLSKLQGERISSQVTAFTPERKVTVAFPQWKLGAKIVGTIARSPYLTALDKPRAMAAAMRYWIAPQWRSFPYDVKRNFDPKTRAWLA